MNLAQHYNTLYNESLKLIKTDNCLTDNLIDNLKDNRYGLTLLIRLNQQINNNINLFLSELSKAEPHQYYYPFHDRHITVMSIISCYAGFQLENIHLQNYIDIIKQCLINLKAIQIEFKGITMSSSCVMIQGFPFDNALNLLRNNLRIAFKDSNLEQSLDRRYLLQTAHATVVRFREPLTQKDEFLEILDKYRNYNFGSMLTNCIELVYNDWYQREKNTKLLYRFSI